MPIASVRDSSDEDDTAELAHLPASQRAIELERRQQRRKRFKKQDDQRLKLASKSQLDIAKTRSAFLAAGQQGNPEIIDWDKDTIAPDPATVRPLHIMKKTLELLKSKWKQERNYTFICDQFKSLRQDLTVQRVKSEFTVQVYETHGRIALEKADLGEYNQCQTQLKQLYNIHKLPGKTDEFVGYRILYLIHTRNKRGIQTFYIDLMKQMEELEVHPEGDAVEHALAVRASLAQGNYHRFFQLYHTAPNLSGYLMDLFLERERLSTLQKLCKAYRPSLPLEFVIDTCGFYPADVSNPHEKKKILADGKRWLSSVGVVTDGVDLDCKASSQGIAAKVQFSSQGVDIKGQIH